MPEFSADHGPNVRACHGFARTPAFAALPEALQTRIDGLLPDLSKSNVVCFAGLAELIYANRQTLPPEALHLGAQMAFVCRVNGWHGLGDGRCMACCMAQPRPSPRPCQPLTRQTKAICAPRRSASGGRVARLA